MITNNSKIEYLAKQLTEYVGLNGNEELAVALYNYDKEVKAITSYTASSDTRVVINYCTYQNEKLTFVYDRTNDVVGDDSTVESDSDFLESVARCIREMSVSNLTDGDADRLEKLASRLRQDTESPASIAAGSSRGDYPWEPLPSELIRKVAQCLHDGTAAQELDQFHSDSLFRLAKKIEQHSIGAIRSEVAMTASDLLERIERLRNTEHRLASDGLLSSVRINLGVDIVEACQALNMALRK